MERGWSLTQMNGVSFEKSLGPLNSLAPFLPHPPPRTWHYFCQGSCRPRGGQKVRHRGKKAALSTVSPSAIKSASLERDGSVFVFFSLSFSFRNIPRTKRFFFSSFIHRVAKLLRNVYDCFALNLKHRRWQNERLTCLAERKVDRTCLRVYVVGRFFYLTKSEGNNFQWRRRKKCYIINVPLAWENFLECLLSVYGLASCFWGFHNIAYSNQMIEFLCAENFS